MALGKFLKTPAESKRYAIEYVDWLDAGEYLATTTIAITPTTDPPLLCQIEPVVNTDTTASFFASGGVAGKTYKLIVSVTTTNGQIKEDAVMIEVRAL